MHPLPSSQSNHLPVASQETHGAESKKTYVMPPNPPKPLTYYQQIMAQNTPIQGYKAIPGYTGTRIELDDAKKAATGTITKKVSIVHEVTGENFRKSGRGFFG